MKRLIWLGLGSNMGNRLDHLKQAVDFVISHPEMKLQKCSRVYETEYVGPGNQDAFLNACVEIQSGLPLLDLLGEFQMLERRLGRQSHGHMKPRPLDVDFLLVDDVEMIDTRLEVPHPRLVERLFVLIPLADIAPDKIIPNSGETVASRCAKIKRKSGPAVTVRQDLVLQSGKPDAIMED